MKIFIKGIAKRTIGLFMKLINKFFLVDNRIVFISFNGKSYSDNPRYISELLHNTRPDYEIIWLFNEPKKMIKKVPRNVKVVKNNTLMSLYILATSKIWVDNFNKSHFLYKGKKQYYVQTWHGDRGFKKILYDRPDNYYKSIPILESKSADLMLAGSEYGEMKIKSAFKYNGEILKYGLPRNDILLEENNDKHIQIKQKLGISEDTNVLLYAPTFRKNSLHNPQSVGDINFHKIIKKLNFVTKQNWICLLRAHSNSVGLEINEINSEYCFDVSDYNEMAELLLITDFLITDYSSVAGDFILRQKPVLLYQPDQEEYIQNERGFYFKINKSPYIVAKNNQEILEYINNFSQKEAIQNCLEIQEFYGTYETGIATKKVVEIIIEMIDEEV